jgi:hypothetical protein
MPDECKDAIVAAVAVGAELVHAGIARFGQRRYNPGLAT